MVTRLETQHLIKCFHNNKNVSIHTHIHIHHMYMHVHMRCLYMCVHGMQCTSVDCHFIRGGGGGGGGGAKGLSEYC